jgi:hypothetical protein
MSRISSGILSLSSFRLGCYLRTRPGANGRAGIIWCSTQVGSSLPEWLVLKYYIPRGRGKSAAPISANVNGLSAFHLLVTRWSSYYGAESPLWKAESRAVDLPGPYTKVLHREAYLFNAKSKVNLLFTLTTGHQGPPDTPQDWNTLDWLDQQGLRVGGRQQEYGETRTASSASRKFKRI